MQVELNNNFSIGSMISYGSLVEFTALVIKSPPITPGQIGDLIANVALWMEKLNIKEVKSHPSPYMSQEVGLHIDKCIIDQGSCIIKLYKHVERIPTLY